MESRVNEAKGNSKIPAVVGRFTRSVEPLKGRKTLIRKVADEVVIDVIWSANLSYRPPWVKSTDPSPPK